MTVVTLDLDLIVILKPEFFQERSLSTNSLLIFFSLSSILKTLWRKRLSSFFTFRKDVKPPVRQKASISDKAMEMRVKVDGSPANVCLKKSRRFCLSVPPLPHGNEPC